MILLNPIHSQGYLFESVCNSATGVRTLLFWGWSLIFTITPREQDVSIQSKTEQAVTKYVHFWTNTFGKGINFFIPLAINEIVPILSLYQDCFDMLLIKECWYDINQMNELILPPKNYLEGIGKQKMKKEDEYNKKTEVEINK